MKYILIILFVNIHVLSYSQSSESKVKTFKNLQIKLEFEYPENWEIGTSSNSDTYWIGLPNYKSIGNVLLRVVPWKYKVDLKNYSKEQYKKDFFTTSILYKDIEFIEYNNKIKISGIDGLFTYYKGFGKYVSKSYYEVVIQWWKNNILYTLQGQFSEPKLNEKQIQEIKKIIKSIKVY
jgi:hypothetical protein